MTHSVDPEFESELAQLVRDGRKIEAVKLYREATGAGLAEAKKAVEEMAGEAMPSSPQHTGSLEQEIAVILQTGNKLEAIKVYREKTGAGLRDSKLAVERIESDLGIGPHSVGCISVLLMAIGSAAVLIPW